MKKPPFKPMCPNHKEVLEGVPFPTPKKGTGVCPVSKCHFDFEVEVDEHEMVMGKDGVMEKKPKWAVNGDEA